MSILFTFPGQGAQRTGMLHALPDDPVVRDVLDATSDTLGQDVLALDTEEALRSTIAVQICLLASGVAMGRCIVGQAGMPDAVAGLSIGAFPAAVIAGVVAYTDAVRLVTLRAQLMEAAYPTGYGMTAILGMEMDSLQQIIRRVHARDAPVYLANINAPTQMVIAGAKHAMARVAELALADGAHAVKPIAISVPSHCPLLEGPSETLAQAVATVSFAAPRMCYFSAGMGRVLRDPMRIADDLARNMAMPVRWHETIVLAAERGVRLAVEMPPGNVLTKLSMTAFSDGIAVAAADTQRDTLAVLMARERVREG
jgi:malonate decarboxylase epsilon subunit